MVDFPFTPAVLPGILGANQRAAFASSGQFYVSGSENLRITVFNSLPGVKVSLEGRVLKGDASLAPIATEMTPTSDRMPSTVNVELGEGIVSHLVVRVTNGSPLIGQTFVQVKLIQGFSGATKVRGVILQGYVTSQQEIGWPGSPIESSVSGGGYVRIVVGTQPAAGAEISETVPTGARWELITAYVGWVGSGAGAPRESRLLLSQSGNDFAISPMPDPLPIAGLTIVNWAQGYNFPAALVNNVFQAALPFGVQLLAGATIRTQTTAIDPADQWQIPRFLVREWIEAA